MSDPLLLSLPRELLAAIRGLGVAWHLRLLAGLESLVGETHLIGTKDGGIHVFSRSSMLAPFEEVVGITRLFIERATLRTDLRMTYQFGAAELRLPLGYREVDELAVHLGGDEAHFEPRGAHTPNEPTPLPPRPETGPYVPATFQEIVAQASLGAVPPEPARFAAGTTSSPPPAIHAADLPTARRAFVEVLRSRARRLRLGKLEGVPFAALLEGEVPRQTRRALLDARDDLEHGRRREALQTLAEAARSPRWQVRVGYAQILLLEGHPKKAFEALEQADLAGAPLAATIDLREDAAREMGTRRELLVALRKKRKYLGPDREAALDAEIDALEAEGARLRAARAEQQRANEAAKAARLQSRADRRRAERATRPPKPTKPARPRKVKSPVDPRVVTLDPPGKRALKPVDRRGAGRPRGATPSAEAKPEMHMGWIVGALALALVLFAYLQFRRNEAKQAAPATTAEQPAR